MIAELLLSATLLASTDLVDLPMQCLREKNHGQCVVCCKADGREAKYCAKFCRFVKPPRPSEEVPEP